MQIFDVFNFEELDLRAPWTDFEFCDFFESAWPKLCNKTDPKWRRWFEDKAQGGATTLGVRRFLESARIAIKIGTGKVEV